MVVQSLPVDGGDNWTEITRNPGLPQQGLLGAIGITVSPAKPSRLWAIVEHEAAGGVYRSDDAGATWTHTSDDRNLRQRAWYYSKLYADPKDTNVVYAPQVSPMVSKDGGKTFARGFGGGDNHDIWIDPTNPERIAVAHDNGTIITGSAAGVVVVVEHQLLPRRLRSRRFTASPVVNRDTSRRIPKTRTSCTVRTTAAAWTC